VSPPFLSLVIVSLRIITLLFVDHDDRIKAFLAHAEAEMFIVLKKRLSKGDETKRDNLNDVVFVRGEFRRIMPAIKWGPVNDRFR